MPKGAWGKTLGKSARSTTIGSGSFLGLCLASLLCCNPALGQTPPAASPSPASVSGTIIDPSGSVVAGAVVKLTHVDSSSSAESVTGSDGQFSFASVPPGPFQLQITAAGFAAQTAGGTLEAGQAYVTPAIMLGIATNVTRVVVVPREVLAEEQLKVQEQQRVLGFVPNFYVSYIPNAAPLNTKQKFELAWKTTVDPVNIGLSAAAAGLEQATDQYSGYGQGAEGYGKRFGAAYADMATSTFIGGAALPSLLKQDPRYFYKGTGGRGSRFLYAVGNVFFCKGDNGRWQPNYSFILGDIVSSGISNAYYPAGERGAALTFENAGIGMGATAAANVIEEFIARKLTSGIPHHQQEEATP